MAFEISKLRPSQIFTIFGLFLILLIAGFSFLSGRQFVKSNERRNHSANVLAHVRELEIMLERAETAQRGYVLTGRKNFLEPYSDAKKVSGSEIQDVENLVQDNPSQSLRFTRIKELTAKRFQHFDSVIALVENGDAASAVKKIREGEGQELMTELRQQFREFVSEEIQLQEARTRRAENDFTWASLLTLVGLLLSFSLLLGVSYLLWRELARRAQIEKDLVKAEAEAKTASALKTQFLANMSHEIRTPLNGVIGMTQILEKTSLDAEQKDHVRTIRDSSHSLLTIINEILDISKIESGKLHLEEAHFELRSLISSLKSLFQFPAEEKNLTFETQVGEEVYDNLIGDALRLRQVLTNLMGNAIKFSENGRILLKVRLLEEKDSQLRVLFEVFDCGPGMDAATQERLFNRFEQADSSISRRFGGTGLGLSISRQLIELMGGRIGVESSRGKGSRFYFEVSFKVAKYVEKLSDSERGQDKKGKIAAHVLVAEDNVTNQKVIALMLKQLGCSFDLAHDGVQAYEFLEKNNYDMILMDGQMPRMDGYQTTEKIRTSTSLGEKKNIPIIAITANAIRGDVEKGYSVGMNDYIAKPVSQVDLEAKLRKWFAAETSIIDVGAIQKLKELDPGGTSGLLRSVIGEFIAAGPAQIAKMRQECDTEDYESLFGTAHHFKSTCANAGAVQVRSLLEQIEKKSRKENKAEIKSYIDLVEKEFFRAAKELEAYES